MKKLLILIGLVVVSVLVGLGFASYWLQSSLTTPIEHGKAAEYIVIEKGSSTAQIIAKLKSEGVVANDTAIMLYLRTMGDASKLKAGEYRFPSPISPMQALNLLEKGEERMSRVTIPEGFTIYDIAKRLDKFQRDIPNAEQGLAIEPGGKLIREERQILELMNDTSLVKDLSPEAKNLEGYMYPSTYEVEPGSSLESVIKRMVDQFRKQWKPEWTAAAKTKGLTPHQVVTIASLVETESKYEQERPIVASVIFNRLSKGIPLGIDQTNVYIAKMLGRWDGTIHQSDLDVESPYNTRKRAGLPPGPISSVTVSSIEAVLNPASTDYIFYVLDVQKNDGSHLFFASAADFERAKADYQRWLEIQRAEKRANEANNSNTQ